MRAFFRHDQPRHCQARHCEELSLRAQRSNPPRHCERSEATVPSLRAQRSNPCLVACRRLGLASMLAQRRLRPICDPHLTRQKVTAVLVAFKAWNG